MKEAYRPSTRDACAPGRPWPMGVTLSDSDGRSGLNIAVYARHATAVELCLFDATAVIESARIRLLACSDGVWHYFSNAEIGSVLATLSAREACEFLIDKARARARGRGDNLSIVVVKLERLE